MQAFNTPAILSVTDITGKVVINIVKKLTEDNTPASEKQDLLKTEIYFLSAQATGSEDNEVIKLIKY